MVGAFVAAEPMIIRGSRYRLVDVYASRDPSRADYPIDGVRPHVAEPTTSRRNHRVASHERLDLIAQRYYGNPLLYWLICDANETIFPDDLLIPGRVLRIPRNKQ
jgi:nucleoid-associated protein YgaU